MALIPIRKRFSRPILASLLATGLVLTAATARGPQTGLVPKSPQGPVERPGFLEVPRENLSPRLLEIREFLEGRSETLQSLNARYRAATDDTEALRIMREIHDLKAGTELGILEIQLRHARIEENHEAVTRLEAALERVEAGPAYQPAPSRPRPEANR